MHTTAHLDWLEFTIPIDVQKENWLPKPLLPNELSTKDGRTAHYNSIFTNELGVIILTNGEQRQGTHILYTGEPLETVRAIGVTDRELVQHLIEHNGKISRLDVAVNIHEGTIKAQDLEGEYMAGRCITRAHGAEKRQKLLTDEDTLYIGSPTSERRFRAYNKGAQLHTDEAWLRLELQLRRLRAMAVGRAIISNVNTRAVYNQAILSFVDFPDVPEYQTALTDNGVPIEPTPRKIHKTYAWLMNTVAPAMAKYAHEHPDEDVFGAFFHAFKYALIQLQDDTPNKP